MGQGENVAQQSPMAKFRQEVKQLLRQVGKTQSLLADEIGIHSTDLSRRLSGGSMSHYEIQRTISTLVKWRAIRSREEVWRLLTLADCPDFASEAWATSPLHWLPRPAPPMADVTPAPSRVYWGEAPAVGEFYGYEPEMRQLEVFVAGQSGRLATLVGLGGMGKTSLALHVAHKMEAQVNRIYWRSMWNAPAPDDVLTECLQFLSDPRNANSVASSSANRILALVECLRRERCLIILDNLETVIAGGRYLPGYELYGQIIRQIATSEHHSVLLITSRDAIPDYDELEARNGTAILQIRLGGLDEQAIRTLLTQRTIMGSDVGWRELTSGYSGNPYALRLAENTIIRQYGGDIDTFLAQMPSLIFGKIRTMLAWHWEHLSQIEQSALITLALARVAQSHSQLAHALHHSHVPLMEILLRLRDLNLVKTDSASTYYVHPLILEYVTGLVLERVVDEVVAGKPILLVQHALLNTDAKEYVRQAQARIIADPILATLVTRLGSPAAVAVRFADILITLRQRGTSGHGYAAGNLINLLARLRSGDLNGYDFSHLAIRQAYVQGVRLHGATLRGSEITESRFTQSFDGVMSLAYSSDGKRLVIGSVNGQVNVWQVGDNALLLSLPAHTKTVRMVTFSADGLYLASAGDDACVRVWDAASGECLLTFEGHNNRVWSVAFSPDGRFFASGGEDHSVKIWDGASGTCLHTLDGHTNWVRSVAYSPDGRWVASGGGDHTVRMWDVARGECVRLFTGHTDRVRGVAFSPDGTLLASCSEDQTVRLWHLADDTQHQVLTGHTNRVRTLSFCADGTALVSAGDDQSLRVWDSRTGVCLRTLHGHEGWIWAAAFSPDGTMAATGGEDQAVRVWDITTGQCVHSQQGYSPWLGGVAFSPDGQHIAAGGESRAVEVWTTATPFRPSRMLLGHTNRIRSVTFSPNGRLIASAAEDCQVRIWSWPEGACRYVLVGHSQRVRSVAFSPDGSLLASGGEDGTIRLWDVHSGMCVRILYNDGMEWVGSLAFSPDGLSLAATGSSYNVCLWSLQTYTICMRFAGHTDRVRAVAFSSDGSYIVSGSVDRTARLWNVADGQCRHILHGHTDRVRGVAFSPDGMIVATAAEDMTIGVWGVTDGEARTFLRGHTDRVWSVVFNQTGDLLASAGEDGTLRLWDWRTGMCLQIIQSARPYEGLDIGGVRSITDAQRTALRSLGAIDG